MSKKIVYNTPKGKAFWANLLKAEEYKGKSTGKYTIQIMPSKVDANKFLLFLDQEFEKAKENHPDFAGVTLKGEPNLSLKEDKEGNMLFKFKTNCEFKTKKGEIIKNIVPIFDAKGKPITNKNIGNNSIIKVAFSTNPYLMAANNYGLTLYLEGIQVLELQEYNGGADAGALGFTEEDGYDASEDNDMAAMFSGSIGGEEEEATEAADF